MSMTRLKLRYVIEQRSDDGGETYEDIYYTEIIDDTAAGNQHAINRWEAEEDHFGGARLFREQWDPEYIIEDGQKYGEWVEVQEWYNDMWSELEHHFDYIVGQ